MIEKKVLTVDEVVTNEITGNVLTARSFTADKMVVQKIYFDSGAQHLYQDGPNLFWFDGTNSIKLN